MRAEENNGKQHLMCNNPKCRKYRKSTYRRGFYDLELDCLICETPLIQYQNRHRAHRDEVAKRELEELEAM
jgi:hypothetical protein